MGTPTSPRRASYPTYPAYLPDGETDFEVSLQAFSKDAVGTFLKIERPALAAGEGVQIIRRERTDGSLRAARVQDDSEEHFFSIGEFYQALERDMVELHTARGDALFSGDPARQVTPDYYYSGGLR